MSERAKWEAQLKAMHDDAQDKVAFLNALREFAHTNSKQKHNPVGLVRWVPLEKVQANNYNPNSVARNEMRLLYTSIKHDGYTQPIVTVYDPEKDKYIIVDGFHRYSIMRFNDDIRAINDGHLPIVVIEKDINDRMASTIRHNRARGKHSITGMADIVFSMLENGWSDAEICNELGMEPEELARLKHITGFAKLFENVEYRRAWETNRQVKLRRDWEAKQRERETGSSNVD